VNHHDFGAKHWGEKSEQGNMIFRWRHRGLKKNTDRSSFCCKRN